MRAGTSPAARHPRRTPIGLSGKASDRMELQPVAMLQTLAIALVAGVVAQFVAERLSIPSIVPLLVGGALLGPEAAGWIEPKTLGHGLEVLVGLSVAIILFEGGLHLEWAHLKSERRVILRLITVGALVTMFAAAAAAWVLLPLNGWTALLLGSMVIVTGPTVIRPLLKRVRIVRRVAFVLESEGVLIDPVGAILAFVVLELVLSGELSFTRGPGSILWRFAAGGAVGAGAGALLTFFLRRRLTSDVDLANLMTLSGVIATYVLANSIRSESGLIAVVVAGIVLGNFSIPGRRELVAFKGILTTLVISLLFVLLSADMRWSILGEVGWGGFVWVALLMVAVRPLSIFASTAGTDTPLADKLLLSWISPRGIVAASVASLFAIYLRREGIPDGELLQALVFLTIAATVLIQGLTAGLWAHVLGLASGALGVVIVGANPTGRALGRLLKALGREVALIDSNAAHCERAKADGLPAFTGNCLEAENLERIGLRAANSLVAVTANREVNYLVSRMALEEFQVPRALVLVAAADKRVDPATREQHRIELAFGRPVSDEVEYRMRRDPSLWSGVVTPGTSAKLGALELEAGLPLVHVRSGRAEVCGEETPITAGDRLYFFGEPKATWLSDVEPWDGTDLAERHASAPSGERQASGG